MVAGRQSSRNARVSSPAASSTTWSTPAADAEAKKSSKKWERTPMYVAIDAHGIAGSSFAQAGGHRYRRSGRVHERFGVRVVDQAVVPVCLDRPAGGHPECGEADSGDDIPLRVLVHAVP